MAYGTKRYIRKVSITRTFYEVIATQDEIEYIKPNLVPIAVWEVGSKEVKSIDPYRKLTEVEDIMVRNVANPDESKKGWDSNNEPI